MASIECGGIDYKEYEKTGNKKFKDMTLSFFNKGVCKMWDEN